MYFIKHYQSQSTDKLNCFNLNHIVDIYNNKIRYSKIGIPRSSFDFLLDIINSNKNIKKMFYFKVHINFNFLILI